MKRKYLTYIFSTIVITQMIFSIPLILPPEGGDVTSIRVMTYNIHQYYVQDPSELVQKTGHYIFEKLLEVIKSSKADIIGLQENEGERLSSGNQNGVVWLATQLGMYYYYGPPTSAQIYGEAILSRWPIVHQEWKAYPTPEGIERGIAYAVIDSPLGELNVYSTHFEIDRFPIAQREQAEFAVNYIGDKKAIVLGDFNTRSDENNEAYHILYDAFTYGLVEAGNHENSSIGFTAPASNPSHKVDYIWLTRGDWNVVLGSYTVYGTPEASDHLAALIELA